MADSRVQKLQEYRRQPAPRRPASPTLIIVPPTLVPQWADEITKVTGELQVVIYYGDHRDTRTSYKVIGPLTRKSKYFDGKERRASVVIVTSYQSLNMRHGPSELCTWLIEEKGMTELAAKSMANTPHPDWPGHLGGLFPTVILDEAHTMRNLSALCTQTALWMDPQFYICLTATPLFNSVHDFQGLQTFILKKDSDDLWNAENLKSWGVTEDVNPFDLDIEHPAACLCLTRRAMSKWIWGRDVTRYTAGLRLRKAWQMCLLRRTLYSSIPFKGGKMIGEDIPPCKHRVVKARFTREEKALYDKLTPPLYRKLVRKNLKTGKLMWNMAKYRQLSLLTTWLDFRHVHSTIKAAGVAAAVRMAQDKTLFFHWLEIIMKQEGIPFDLDPKNPNDYERVLTLILRCSPRLRALLPIITEQVLKMKEKAIVWCLFPAQQVFVAAALCLANIDAQVFHAGLTPTERANLVREFNESKDTCMVLVCSYSVNSSGLNLQHLCRNVHLFDTPISEAIKRQAIGRTWRLGQVDFVLVYDYNVPDSFNTRQVSNAAEKAIPGLIAELNQGLFQMNHIDDGKIVLGNWGRTVTGEVRHFADGEEVPEDVDLLDLGVVMHEIMKVMKGEVSDGLEGNVVAEDAIPMDTT
jgi:hypothetical protein